MNKILTVGCLAVLAASALGQPRLTSVTHKQVGEGLQIEIGGKNLPKPTTTTVMNGTSTIIEFPGAVVNRKGRTTIGRFGIKYYEWLNFNKKPQIARVHLKKVLSAKPEIIQEDGTWFVRIGKWPAKETTFVDDLRTMQLETIEPNVESPVVMPEPFVQQANTEKIATPFPESVPPIVTTKKQTKPPVMALNEPNPAPTNAKNVSLDFVATDVVQILKALSIQAGVNIIASPEVSPVDKPLKLTLSLYDVALDDALSMITAMSGLRYGRVGSTFVVTPSAGFSDAMRQIMERFASTYETRVVNLMSGEASKIKEATLKALPQDGRNGFYEIVVPSDDFDTKAATTPVNGQPATADGGPVTDPTAQAAPPTGQGSQPGKPKVATTRAFYLMLVGDSTRLSAVENYVKELDRKIAESFSVSRSADTDTVVVAVQSGQTQRIQEMLNALLAENPRAGDFSISESQLRELASGELSTKVLMMIGPKTEIAALANFTRQIDKNLCAAAGITYEEDLVAMEKVYEVVDLKYLEPIIAEQDLKGRFRGLWVTVAPDPVTPGISGEDESKKQEAPEDTGAKPGATKQEESKLKKGVGREPMRLILRGTRSQIQEAKAYLAMIDVAPRQVALELRVMELTKEDAMRIGIDWNLITGGRLTNIRLNQGFGDSPASAGTISGGYQFQDTDKGDFLATIDKKVDGNRLIARPNALVSDGRSTSLFVGDTVRYIKSITTSQNGTTVLTDDVQVGAKFDIWARIGGDGSISLELAQNFSILTGFLSVPGGGSLPQTSDRLTNMHVDMKSGETIAIGGLILDQDRKKLTGIPILMDLPIIGKFFSRTEDSRKRTEIVFFLRAVEVGQGTRNDAANPRNSLDKIPDPMKDYLNGAKNPGDPSKKKD